MKFQWLIAMKQTISFNRDILLGNAHETDELLVQDFMKELGYNRRYRHNIGKSESNGVVHWVIGFDSGKRFKLDVYGLETDLNSLTSDPSNEESDENLMCRFVTDGEKLGLLSKAGEPEVLCNLYDDSDATNSLIDCMRSEGELESYLLTTVKGVVSTKVSEMLKQGTFNTMGIFSSEFYRVLGIEEPNDFIANEVLEGVLGVFGTPSGSGDTSHIVDNLTESDTEQVEVDPIDKSGLTESELDLIEANGNLLELEAKLDEANKNNEAMKLSVSVAEQALARANEDNERLRVQLKSTKDAYDEKVAEASSLSEKLGTIESSTPETPTESTSDPDNTDKIKSLTNQIKEYREQIEKLHIDVCKYQDVVEDQKKQIAGMISDLDSGEDTRITQSRSLLDTIEDIPELNRSYVGVVNGNLFQAATLEMFIGTALQELYNIVTFDLMPYIFDGDIFKITDKAVRNDFMLNGKFYDIDLSGMTEVESRQRLSTLFSKFQPAVIFFSKAIGTNRVYYENCGYTGDETTEGVTNPEDGDFVDSESFEGMAEYTGEDSANQCEIPYDSVGLENPQDVEVAEGVSGEADKMVYSTEPMEPMEDCLAVEGGDTIGLGDDTLVTGNCIDQSEADEPIADSDLIEFNECTELEGVEGDETTEGAEVTEATEAVDVETVDGIEAVGVEGTEGPDGIEAETVSVEPETVSVEPETVSVEPETVDTVEDQPIETVEQPEVITSEAIMKVQQGLSMVDQMIEAAEQSIGAAEQPIEVVEQPVEDINQYGLFGFAIADVGAVIWDEDVELGDPVMLMTESKLYQLDTTDLESQIKSIIYAIICNSPEIDKTIIDMKNVDFRVISNLVTENSNESVDGIKIPYTRYQINAKVLGQAVAVFQKVCEIASVDDSDIFIYFDGTIHNAKYLNNEIDAATLLIEDNSANASSLLASEEQIHCIISGSILNAIVLNREQIDIQHNLIKECIAVRTSDLTSQINDSEDIAHVMTEMLVNSEIPIEDVIDRLGTVINEKYKVISLEQNEVNSKNFTVQFNGTDYYISEMEPWQLLYTLLHLHVLTTGNNSISIRIILNKALFDFYVTEHTSANPVADAAVRSFVSYASSRIKK